MDRNKYFAWTLASSLCITLASSLMAQQPAPATALPGPYSASAQTSGGPSLQERYPRYVLKREDVINLTFPISPELNQTVTIQPDGYINLQSAGSLHVSGMTVPELVTAVKGAYAGILKDPIVDADLTDFQRPLFTVSGQVGKPGQYELRSDITVSQALAVAGGMTMLTAKTQVFLFHRTQQNWYEVKKVNLKDVLGGKNVNEDSLVQAGDMIYVPENFISRFRKYVPYSISPGFYAQAPVL